MPSDYSEAGLASPNIDALRCNALQLVPTPVALSELHRTWIPCPTVIRKKHQADLLDELATDSKFGTTLRIPDEVTDRTIFDWFDSHGAPPTCILPTYMRNGLPSRVRTVYFAQDQAPKILVPSPNEPLREFFLASSDDGMVTLRSCFINHKVARHNRVTPHPSGNALNKRQRK
ncbi:hypothetical protein Plhal304r1_c003g0010461 [Plasmopara halstedii]